MNLFDKRICNGDTELTSILGEWVFSSLITSLYCWTMSAVFVVKKCN